MLKCVPPATDSGWMSVWVTGRSTCRATLFEAEAKAASISFGTLGGRSAPGSGPESASTSGRVSGVLVSKIGSPASIFWATITRSPVTFYLQAGAASADYMVVRVPTGGERADSTYFSGTAWGITTAVGWDIPVHGSVSLRPLLSYSYGPPRGLHSSDGTVIATGWKHHLLSLDVALVFHPRDSS